jgi:pimeloyl-ACP methyl ester carboxylesterase
LACAEPAATRRFFFSLLLAAALTGCGALPDVPDSAADFLPAPGSTRDLRAQYRVALCTRTAPDTTACEQTLLREAGEVPAPPQGAAVTDLNHRYRIRIVPGLFAECLAAVLRPFADVEPVLRARGYDVAYLDVPGRGTAETNARYLAAKVAEDPDDRRPILFIAYSKGLVDVLEFLVRYPELANRVGAVISLAGASVGSPLADAFQYAYRDLLAGLPISACAGSEGDEILDLRRDLRQQWWSRNASSIMVPIFSLVTTPREDRVSAVLQLPYTKLASIDPRNDGQLLWFDQLVPGGYLLGYVNADHWAVALALSDSLPALSFLFNDDVPRPALVEAAIETAGRVLTGTLPR